MTELEIAKTSTALNEQSKHYPASWFGKVPLKIRMAKTVTPDLPIMLSVKQQWAQKSIEYYVYCNPHGALSVIFPDGKKLGIKPFEYEIIEWHEKTV